MKKITNYVKGVLYISKVTKFVIWDKTAYNNITITID